MTKAELEKKIRLQAGNLIYCWIYDDDKKYLGSKANVIIAKRDKQVAYLKALAYAVGVKEDLIYEWVLDEIANTYQKIKNPATKQWETATPRLIIAALMLGETVNGKNWSKGIYGCNKVGDVETPTVSQEIVTSGRLEYVSLDGNYGMGSSNQLVVPTYDLSVSKSQPSSVSLIDKMDNIVNTYKLTSNGEYKLDTISDGTTTKSASTGQTLTVKDQAYWDNIANIIGQINGLINTFATALSGITAAEALSPLQVEDGWVEPVDTKNSGMLTGSTGLLLGGAVLAGAFLLNKKK